MVSILAGTAAVVCDQVLKRKIESGEIPDGKKVAGDLVTLRNTRNTGFVMNRLSSAPGAVTAVSSAVWGALMVAYIDMLAKDPDMLKKAGLSLVLGGGLSNIIDRVRQGGVTDYLQVKHVSGTVFNIGDLAVALGGLLAGIALIRED